MQAQEPNGIGVVDGVSGGEDFSECALPVNSEVRNVDSEAHDQVASGLAGAAQQLELVRLDAQKGRADPEVRAGTPVAGHIPEQSRQKTRLGLEPKPAPTATRSRSPPLETRNSPLRVGWHFTVGAKTREESQSAGGEGRMLLGLAWVVALIAVWIGETVSLWAAFVYVMTVTVALLYAWATK